MICKKRNVNILYTTNCLGFEQKRLCLIKAEGMINNASILNDKFKNTEADADIKGSQGCLLNFG